ncbi:MAG: hypothetical protein KGI58_01010 [Patescibacteria group bacterium]|nr:hypothetical protein [Patescibacteria group bacterium]
MKFNFEKNIPVSKQEDINLSEQTSEQFDADILQESKKLEINLQKLNEEINVFGGKEKFQKEFSSDSGTSGMTKGGEEIHEENSLSYYQKELAKALAVFSGGSAVGATSLYYLTEAFNLHSDPTILGLAGSATVLGSAIMSINLLIKSKVHAREAKRMELKMKMTDTPLNY